MVNLQDNLHPLRYNDSYQGKICPQKPLGADMLI
jgi:hypothetical protein